MKALCGFSPLSIAMLFTAALTLPILLFPFGGVLLANAAFSRANSHFVKSGEACFFKIFVVISTAANLILFTIIAILGFNRSYEYFIEVALLGSLLMNELPRDTSAGLYIFNIIGFIFCFNGLVIYHFWKISVQSSKMIKSYSWHRFSIMASGSKILNLSLFLISFFVLIYLIEIPHRDRPYSRENWAGGEIMLTPLVLFCCYHSYIRCVTNKIVYPNL